MSGLFAFLSILADFLNRIMASYDEKQTQEVADRVDASPSAEFLRRFKRQ